ncbi:MAG: hypothetical protein JXA42_15560 [Anaerolineales bacterium]|nr:hypothetical protein [Anaerolineales bacterium]
MLKIIIDFDGTLTAEEMQVSSLAKLSLETLSREILHTSQDELEEAYQSTRNRLLQNPHQYWWEVNGLIASYCNEGAFILNTTTLQVMLRENYDYLQAVSIAFPRAEYDPVVDCTNALFHRHTAELAPIFRPSSCGVLNELISHPFLTPIVLTNSLSDKVKRHLDTLPLLSEISVLGDTRQYEMDPSWPHHFHHPHYGDIQRWPVLEGYTIDLRRPAYFRALEKESIDGSQLAVVADTLSLPGALPLIMGIHFFLLATPYTPSWCRQVVESHPFGTVLEDIGQLPSKLGTIEK